MSPVPQARRHPIRVLVVDDSPTARVLLTEILASDPAITVVGEASNGVEAVEKAVKLAPDLITMDVHMPIMDGLQATKEIMIAAPTPILIVSASVSRNALGLSFDATQAGALMVVSKPHNPLSESFAERRDQLLQMVKTMAQVRVVRRRGPRPQPAAAIGEVARLHPPALGAAKDFSTLVAIGTSIGGPAALRRILMDLPPDFGAPIVVVQHIAAGFVGGLATWLSGSSSLHVKVAQDAEPLKPRTVYLAPDDRHLGVRADGTTLLSGAPPIGGFRPSATFLFESAARAFGSRVIALILTGMGSDGVTGLKALRAAGARVLAQDEATSVVYGMAHEAARAGVVDATLPLEQLAPRLAEFVE